MQKSSVPLEGCGIIMMLDVGSGLKFVYDIVHLHEDHFYCVYTTTCLHLANLLN